MIRLGTNYVLNKKDIDTYPALKSKDDFLKVLNKETKRKVSSYYTVFTHAGEIYLCKVVGQDKAAQLEYINKYKPESDELFEYWKKILQIERDDNPTVLSANIFNSFTLIGNTLILDTIITRKMIEIDGEQVFNTFKHKSKNGKIRDITAPHEKIKEPLQKLNNLFQRVYDYKTIDFQIAYKKGKNVKDGAKIHKNHNYIFNIDLKDFYPSCKRELVKKYTDFLFAYTFNREFIENEFLNSILINDALFIGSPISGTLANAIVSKPAMYLKNICKKYDMAFSIYADDMTFSSDKFIVYDFIKEIFDLAFAEYGLSTYFTMNAKKSVGFSAHKRKITGVSINADNEITIPRRYFRDIRTQLEHLAHGDSKVNIGKLRGKIAYATAIDDTGKVARYLNKYLDTVQQYNLCSEEKLNSLKKGE